MQNKVPGLHFEVQQMRMDLLYSSKFFQRKLPEVQHLVMRMLAAEPEQRLQASQCRQHPALWEDERKLLFVRCVSDEPELTDEKSSFVAALEECAGSIFGSGLSVGALASGLGGGGEGA